MDLIEFKVRCSGKLHRIQIDKDSGRFIMADHLDPEYDEACRVMAAMDDKAPYISRNGSNKKVPRCHYMLDAMKVKAYYYFPEPAKTYVTNQTRKYWERRTARQTMAKLRIERVGGRTREHLTGDKLAVEPFRNRLCEKVRKLLAGELRHTIYRKQLRAAFGKDNVKRTDIKISILPDLTSPVNKSSVAQRHQPHALKGYTWLPQGDPEYRFAFEMALPLEWYQRVRSRGVTIVSGHLVVDVERVASNGSMKALAARLAQRNKQMTLTEDDAVNTRMIFQEAIITKHADKYQLRFINPERAIHPTSVNGRR